MNKINEYYEKYNKLAKNRKNKYSEDLKIDKSLNQIKLSANKLDMFVNWWNEDIVTQKDIPQAFNEGYFILENDFARINDTEILKERIREQAKELKTTYRIVEEAYNKMLQNLKTIIIYFKFDNNKLDLVGYCDKKQIFYNCFENFKEEYPPYQINRYIDFENFSLSKDETGEEMMYNCITIFITIMWYITTTKNIHKYKYEVPRYNSENNNEPKNIVEVQRQKTISTPIYDITKIKTVKVDSLIKRRKGWTYSHAFQVHGHYRHYSDGKVVFIEPFIKGKNKELKPQEFIINPKE